MLFFFPSLEDGGNLPMWAERQKNLLRPSWTPCMWCVTWTWRHPQNSGAIALSVVFLHFFFFISGGGGGGGCNGPLEEACRELSPPQPWVSLTTQEEKNREQASKIGGKGKTKTRQEATGSSNDNNPPENKEAETSPLFTQVVHSTCKRTLNNNNNNK